MSTNNFCTGLTPIDNVQCNIIKDEDKCKNNKTWTGINNCKWVAEGQVCQSHKECVKNGIILSTKEQLRCCRGKCSKSQKTASGGFPFVFP